MTIPTKVFYSIHIVILVTTLMASPARSQMDSLHLVEESASHKQDSSYRESKSAIVSILSGGFVTDVHCQGTGGIVDLTVLHNKNVFGASFTSEGIGSVVTYQQGGFLLFNAAQISYAADLRQIIALHYGRQVSKLITMTCGIAWMMHSSRSTINGHNDPGWFPDYHADLVVHEDDSPAIPLTVKSTFNITSWCCMELHAQAVISMNDTWVNAGMSIGLGNLDPAK